MVLSQALLQLLELLPKVRVLLLQVHVLILELVLLAHEGYHQQKESQF